MSHIQVSPCYLEVELSYENCPNPKWLKVKNNFPLSYMEIFFSIPRTKNSPVLGFSDSLGYILPTDVQYTPRSSSDAHRRNSKLRQLNAKIVNMVPREDAWRCHSCCWGLLQNTEYCFGFCFFSQKQKSLSKWKQVLMLSLGWSEWRAGRLGGSVIGRPAFGLGPATRVLG